MWQRLKWKFRKISGILAIFAVIEELPAVDKKANLNDGNIIIRVYPNWWNSDSSQWMSWKPNASALSQNSKKLNILTGNRNLTAKFVPLVRAILCPQDFMNVHNCFSLFWIRIHVQLLQYGKICCWRFLSCIRIKFQNTCMITTNLHVIHHFSI